MCANFYISGQFLQHWCDSKGPRLPPLHQGAAHRGGGGWLLRPCFRGEPPVHLQIPLQATSQPWFVAMIYYTLFCTARARVWWGGMRCPVYTAWTLSWRLLLEVAALPLWGLTLKVRLKTLKQIFFTYSADIFSHFFVGKAYGQILGDYKLVNLPELDMIKTTV